MRSIIVGMTVLLLATPAHARKAHTDANGNTVMHSKVCTKSGKCVRVAPSAQAKLQCVIDYVENAGVKIAYMRGYGRGTVRTSMHPSGNALDINQTARNRTRPHVPVSVSNGAADRCGVVSGARWGYADNGHWNISRGTLARRD